MDDYKCKKMSFINGHADRTLSVRLMLDDSYKIESGYVRKLEEELAKAHKSLILANDEKNIMAELLKDLAIARIRDLKKSNRKVETDDLIRVCKMILVETTEQEDILDERD